MDLKQLLGRSLSRVSYDAETGQWRFFFAGDVVLQVDAAWRVMADGRLSHGWRDDGQLFGLQAPVDAAESVPALCAGGVVSAVAAAGTSGDLSVRFGSGGVLEVFNDSSGYEGWIVNGPGERYVVAQGGGTVVDSEGGR